MAEGSAASKAPPARDMRSRLSARIRERIQQDYGGPESMRRTILNYVAEERYDTALSELEKYVESKADYPQFKERVARYVTYATGLVNGIRAKRSFPGLQSLAMGKQQELFESALGHFSELLTTLKKIEQIEGEVRLEDIRSTVWVVKALVYSIAAMLLVAFLREVSRGVVPAAGAVADGAASDVANWICDKIGL